MSAIAEASSSEAAHALVAETFGFEASEISLADAEVGLSSTFSFTSLNLSVGRQIRLHDSRTTSGRSECLRRRGGPDPSTICPAWWRTWREGSR